MSIDTAVPTLGQPPQVNPRILRMDSFQDEKDLHDYVSEQPFCMEKGMFDLEMDPFNFELDDLDLAGYEDENLAPVLNVNASVVDVTPCAHDNTIQAAPTYHIATAAPSVSSSPFCSNYDWELMTQKKELGQIAPLPFSFAEDSKPKEDKETQKRIPLAPRHTTHGNTLNIQRTTRAMTQADHVNKMDPVNKPEPLMCRLTISAKPYTPSESSDLNEMFSPSGAQRKICLQAGCTNRARSHQRCKKHGGARQCTFEGCVKNSQSRGLCIAHGGGSRCRFEGCKRASQSRGLCKSHGGGKFCAVAGCKKKAHLKQLCRMHGGGERCKVVKCLKWAQKKGWCMAHAKEMEQ
ncbi:hypothetical protein LEN26_020432 [Aphanomyces euteiches]|nr:hypothetical protein LEN26_020432 [Aphanomyces euteiches]KAH9107854.1 hypothetical protein AeMF1_016855 [Aphanomyces euteiches]